MNYFTTYWKNATWERLRKSNYPLAHTAGENLRDRVRPGDAVYVVTILKGKLYVACKIVVDEICDKKRASTLLQTDENGLWDATDHIIARSSTKPNWNCRISDAITQELEFYTPDLQSTKKLRFRSPGVLDGQTLRATRMLTSSSAALLDPFLGRIAKAGVKSTRKDSVWEGTTDSDDIEYDFESAAEGKQGKRYVAFYERKKKHRNKAIRIHGVICKGCGFNFETEYGTHGKDFIHVHHTVPLSQYESAREPNVETEMTVLCPNCHAMVHRNKKHTLSLAELRALLRR